MDKEEILKWAKLYDEKFPEWTKTERELGDKLRKTQEVTIEDLVVMSNWKFSGNEPRRINNLRNVKKNNDEDVKNITRRAFLDAKSDKQKTDLLDSLWGVGTAMASVILTFFNPKKYCVFDIHVWKELFGEKRKILYKTENYLEVLAKLGNEAKSYDQDVRTAEKAYFTKNYYKGNKQCIQ